MDILGEKIKQSLRMGDVYTRYSSCQYLVMVLDVSIENVGVIADRICSAYYQMHQETADNLILHHSYPLKPARDGPGPPVPSEALTRQIPTGTAAATINGPYKINHPELRQSFWENSSTRGLPYTVQN